MAHALMIAPLNAANFESGNASAGTVLTADGSGGASWQATLPVGTVVQAPSSPGSNWLEMSNQEVNRVDYPELSSVVPTVQFNGPPVLVGISPWTSAPSPVWNGSVWCTVPSNGTKSYLSTDCSSWTEYSGSIPTARSWSSIHWLGDQWMVLCYGARYVLTSPNGITWTERDLGTSSPTGWRAAVNSGTTIILAAAYSNMGRQSTDGGVTWSAYTFPFSFSNDASLYKDPSASRVWVCNGNTIAFSENHGASWTQRTSKYDTRYASSGALAFNLLSFRGSRIYAGHFDRLTYSDDLGDTWTGILMPNFPFNNTNFKPEVPSTGSEIYLSSLQMYYSPDDGVLLGIDSIGPVYRFTNTSNLANFVRPYQSGATKIYLGKPQVSQFHYSSWLKPYVKVAT